MSNRTNMSVYQSNLTSVDVSSSTSIAAGSTSNLRKRHLDSSEDIFDDEYDDATNDLNSLETDVEDVPEKSMAHDTENKNIMVAVEALGKLKNSSMDSLGAPLLVTPNGNNKIGATSAANITTVSGLGTTINGNSHANKDGKNYQQKFFNKVSNYYQSSKDYSPTFKVGAEFVEKKAMPIVKRIEQRFPNSSISMIRNNFINNSTMQNQRTFSYIQSQQQKLQNWNLNVSIESKKNLKVLLRILKLANDRLSNGVDNLHHLITEKEKKILAGGGAESDDDDEEEESGFNDRPSLQNSRSSKRQKLGKKKDGMKQVKRDIVVTVKKAVDVISKFAGNSLPEPARDSVRDVLLRLPENLSKALNTDIEEYHTPMSSVPGSPVMTPTTGFPMGTPAACSLSAIPASSLSAVPASPTPSARSNFLKFHSIDPNFTNRKILILAKESLDSFANIIKIFDSNLQKVDNWVDVEKKKEIEKLRNLKGEKENDGVPKKSAGNEAVSTNDISLNEKLATQANEMKNCNEMEEKLEQEKL
ncbi:transcriptional regulator [Saccharomycopsis crataegensis]|uniref:Transcriptional regulator n=1 Tax=Saccharomycopsis crataegensis TaxID=43959 RepID=A0AAV5QVR7_9ASCO|nr:transcriptional regulator [Saccharomycopsis crataegensis]